MLMLMRSYKKVVEKLRFRTQACCLLLSVLALLHAEPSETCRGSNLLCWGMLLLMNDYCSWRQPRYHDWNEDSPSWMAQLVGALACTPWVVGSIPGQSMYERELINDSLSHRCFSLSLSLSLSLSKSINISSGEDEKNKLRQESFVF